MFKRFFDWIIQRLKLVRAKTVFLLTRKPTVSFFLLLIILFGIIALGNFLRAPKQEGAVAEVEKKETAVFVPLSDTPTLKTPAQVTKEGLVQIVALTPGIVSRVSTSVGKQVYPGQILVSLTTDYNSGKANLEKAVAANNAKLTEDLARIDKRIFQLEEKRIRHNAFLSSTEEDIELKRLKKDRASRRTTLANNPLQLQIAQLSDAILKPKTFVAGVVQSIEVQPGDFVMAGQTLVTLHSSKGIATIEALVSQKTAQLFDPTKETILHLGDEKITLLPTYFSQQETVNGLYSILFTLSQSIENKIVDGEYLSIELPLRAVSLDTLLLPIDAVFQDSETASVLVEENNKAVSKIITLGNTFGSFVEITKGLEKDARVILNHAVIEGDEVIVR